MAVHTHVRARSLVVEIERAGPPGILRARAITIIAFVPNAPDLARERDAILATRIILLVTGRQENSFDASSVVASSFHLTRLHMQKYS